jgi:uncharacterized protein YbaP (TraB family)
MIVGRVRRAWLALLVCVAAVALWDADRFLIGPAGGPAGSALAAQGELQSFDRGLLWRIEKRGTAASYIFGTVHLADARATTLPAAVSKELDAAQSFTMEIALDPANIVELVARMVYEDGRLPAIIGDDLFAQVVPLLAEIGIPSEFARRFKPWAAMLMLAIPPQKPDEVLDYKLHGIASQQGKRIHYLETVDDQVAAFEGMKIADQVALLRYAVQTHGELKATTGRLLEAYLQRDLGLMWRISESGAEGRPDLKVLNAIFTQRLLFDRNTRMAAGMQPQLKAGRAFIAVGALHLYGDKGVLRLLQRDGYAVSRVY